MTRSMILAALLPLAATAMAQDGDRRDYGRPIDSPDNRADMALRFAARCVFDKAPPSAHKVLATEIGSEEEAKKVKGLRGAARECFEQQWPAFPATPFRDAMAEVEYRRSNRQETQIAMNAPPATFAIVSPDRHGTPQQEAVWQLAAIANCAVFAGPHEARQWIIGPRNVDEEQRRFATFKPAIGKCVAPTTVDALTARNFRGPVAAALLARSEKK